MKPKVIFLVGPTASGKTKLSLLWAKPLDAQIVSCDSMQVYKGMRILSSQPSLAQTKKIKHYLLNIVSPEEEFNVSQYRKLALAAVDKIIKQGKTPFFVGGSGLYMSVVVDGIFEAKTEDPKVRQELYAQAEQFSSGYLYGKLKEIDPQAAGKIHPHDTRRLVRALEVFEVTGKPISLLQKTRSGLAQTHDVEIFCLDIEREELYKRIDQRVEQMFEDGLVNEVKKLLKLRISKTAACAIGINEIKAMLEGRFSLEEAKELMKKNTRNYARRQLTWFRKDKRIKWASPDKLWK